MSLTATTSLMETIRQKAQTPSSFTHLKVLVYGLPGVGKTVFAGTAPNPLLIDVERGSISLANHETTKDTACLSFKSLQQVHSIVTAIQDQPSVYDTIIIDSLSEMQRKVLDNQIQNNMEPFIPTGPDWNKNTNALRHLVSKLTELPINVIVTCHVKEEKDEKTGRILIRPDLTPKLSSSTCAAFDIVGYMKLDQVDKDNFERNMYLRGSDRYISKSRIGGNVLNNPTFNDLVSLLNGNPKSEDK